MKEISEIEELIRQNRIDVAIVGLEDILDERPDDVVALMLFGVCQQMKGRTESFCEVYCNLAPSMLVRDASGEDSPVVSRWRHYCRVAAYLVALGVITMTGIGSAEPVSGLFDGNNVCVSVTNKKSDCFAELAKTAADPAVEAEFSEPDGAAIKLKEDGSFQILARGTGTYDFNDPDDIKDAKKEAVLKAKASLVKFMNEMLSTEEGFSEIKNHADALLRGVIIIKMQKIARGAGGEVQATVGVSSEMLQAEARTLYNMGGDLPEKRTRYNMGGGLTRELNNEGPDDEF